MNTKLAAKFPFMKDAAEMAAENEADIEKLLSSYEFEDARARGVERLEDTIKDADKGVSYVSLNKEEDRLVEVMSYPYARMIVSCINDRYLTKRYAIAESKRMNRLLGEEEYGTVLEIAKTLGVRSQNGDNGLMMHFSDYLKFSSRIKSTEWKLVNTEMKNGYVILTHEKFDRVLENALVDKIESELPLDVPDEYRKLMQNDIDHVSLLLTESKNRFNPGFSGELNKDHLPPCIRTLLANAQNGVNLPHSGRFAMVSFLHAIGMNSDQILTLFSQSPDFDESKSSYQIRHITGELNGSDGYTPPECSTMKTNGICFEPDNLCDNDKVNHPLTYFRIKSGTKRPDAPKE